LDTIYSQDGLSLIELVPRGLRSVLTGSLARHWPGVRCHWV